MSKLSTRLIVTIAVIAVLVSSTFIGAFQYVKVDGKHDYDVDEMDETADFVQYMHKDGGDRLTNGTEGDNRTEDTITSGDTYKWVQETGMDSSQTVEDLYSRLYLEPLQEMEISISGDDGSKSGWNVTTVDINGGGQEDVVVGAPYNNSEKGVVHIYFGENIESDTSSLNADDADVTIHGVSTSDRFGWSVANVSDFDGHGIDDLAIGAPGAGNVYVFEGRSSWNSEYTADEAEVVIDGDPGDDFGAAVGGKADLTGDGNVFVGAPEADNGRGNVHVYEYRTGTLTPDDAVLNITGKHVGDNFGHSLAGTRSVADKSGDWTDLIVGAPFAPEGDSTGRTYVFYGEGTPEGSLPENDWNLSKRNANVTLVGESTGDRFGWSVFSAGDVNDDDYGDIVVGAPRAQETGRAYVYLGGEDLDGKDSSNNLASTEESSLKSGGDEETKDVEENDNSESSPSEKESLEREEIDLDSGSKGDDESDTSDIDGELKADSDNLMEVISGNHSESDRYGWNVSKSDVNDDGYNDTLIGAPYNDTGGTEAGAVYVFFGYENIDKGDLKPSNANVTIYGEIAGGHFGWDVAGVGDTNATDKYEDVLVGCPHSQNGSAYLIEGYDIMEQADGDGEIYVSDSDVSITNITGAYEGDKFGASVSGAGNVDGANNDDFIVGAWNASIQSGKDNENIMFEGFEGDTSNWSTYQIGIDTSSQGWVKSTTRSFSGDYCAFHDDDDNGDSDYVDDWLVSPQINVSKFKNLKLEFFSFTDFTTYYYNHSIEISTGSGNPEDGDFEFVKEIDNPQDSWNKRNLDISEYDGKHIYLGFRYQGDYDDEWHVDDIYLNGTSRESKGSTFIFHGDENIQTSASDADVRLNGTSSGDKFGFSVSEGGDVNGDGNADILVGAPGAEKAYVYYSPDLGSETTIFSPKSNKDMDFGWDVANVKNFYSESGKDTVVVGAPKADVDGSSNQGKIYVYSHDDINQAEDSIYNDTQSDFTSEGSSLDTNNPNHHVLATTDGYLTREPIFHESFEDDTVTNEPTEWYVDESSNTNISVENSQNNTGNKSTYIIDDATGGGVGAQMNHSLSKGVEKGAFEFYFYNKKSFSSYYDNLNIMLRNGENEGPTIWTFNEDGNHKIQTWNDQGDGYRDIITNYYANEWYHVKFVFDCTSFTYNIYINGVNYGTFSFYNDITSVDNILINTDYWTSYDTKVEAYVDDISIRGTDDGSYNSSPKSVSGDITGVKYDWNITEPAGTKTWVNISRDGGATWNQSSLKEGEWYYFNNGEPAGRELVYNISFRSEMGNSSRVDDITVYYSYLSPKGNITGEASGDQFGYSLDGGDVDSDGNADLIAGAPYQDGAGSNRGRVYLFNGSESVPNSASDADMRWTGPGDSNYTGWSVAHLGYIGDVDPIAVGSPGWYSWQGNVTVIRTPVWISVEFAADTAVGYDLTQDHATQVTVGGSSYWVWDTSSKTVSVRKGTTYAFDVIAPNSTDPGNQRWTNHPHETGEVSSSDDGGTITAVYYEQLNITYGASNAAHDCGSTLTTNITVSYEENSSASSVDVGDDKQRWADNTTSYDYQYGVDTASRERWYTTSSNRTGSISPSLSPVRPMYYHQYNISVSTTGGYLTSDYSTSLYWSNTSQSVSTTIYDSVSPKKRWMDCGSTFDVSDSVNGPDSPRDVTYVCDDNESTVSGDSYTHEFLFHAEFAPDITIDGPDQSNHPDARFGKSVSGGLDYFDSGTDDVLIGAPNYSEGRGNIRLFCGNVSGGEWTIGTNLSIDDSKWSQEGANVDDKLGTSVHASDDLTGDRLPNLLAGAPGENSGGVTHIYGIGETPTVTLDFYVDEDGDGTGETKFGEKEFTADNGDDWYVEKIDLVSDSYTIESGEKIVFNFTVSASGGSSVVTFVYGDSTYNSRYEFGTALGEARVKWVKTWDADKSEATGNWSQPYDMGEHVTIRANVTADNKDLISGAKMYLRSGIVLEKGLEMTEVDNGSDWKVFEYTYDTSDLNYEGRFLVRVIAVDSHGGTDRGYGETADNTVRFRVFESG